MEKLTIKFSKFRNYN